ncbi:hypothetical protein FGG08_002978 [Glutinoglossum americanum]|uniref:BZIP transcription factor n=1 Tax=Glutinoglossum americanum TaxID=1670608 RepID=A0A9P8IBZ1_9PEZI|nr:hypothetical protein FGG08_002978 [Glutinoglossum americanum]
MLEKRQSAREVSSSPATQRSGGPRRRISRVGTRKVSALTSAQLERKRANDREAQRAIRQRTRDQIERLEAQIAGLSADEEAMQNALLLNKRLELENSELRAKLESTEMLFDTFRNGLNLDDLDVGLGNGRYNPLPQDYTLPSATDDLPFRVPPLGSPPTSSALSQMPRSPHGSIYTDGIETMHSPYPLSSVSGLPPSDETTAWWPKESIHQGAPPGDIEVAAIPDLDWATPTSTGLGFLLESDTPHRRSPTYTGQLQAEDETYESSTRFVEAGTFPTGTEHGPSVDSFIHNQRHLASGGSTDLQLIGPKYPNVSALFDSKQGIRSHPVSKILTDIIGGLPKLSGIPERVAVLYVTYLLLQWRISPTPQTYESLPEWLCPRASQLVTPHPIWMDPIPWPRLRDRIINDQETYSTLEFQDIITRSVRVNWSQRPIEALVLGEGEIRMSSTFELHIRKLENWNLGPAFMQRYPELMETTEVMI